MAYVTSPRSKCRRLGLGVSHTFPFSFAYFIGNERTTSETIAAALGNELIQRIPQLLLGY
jgi:hypothetical protein